MRILAREKCGLRVAAARMLLIGIGERPAALRAMPERFALTTFRHAGLSRPCPAAALECGGYQVASLPIARKDATVAQQRHFERLLTNSRVVGHLEGLSIHGHDITTVWTRHRAQRLL